MEEVKSPASAVTINAISSIFAHICSILERDVEAEFCDSCSQWEQGWGSSPLTFSLYRVDFILS